MQIGYGLLICPYCITVKMISTAKRIRFTERKGIFFRVQTRENVVETSKKAELQKNDRKRIQDFVDSKVT